MQIATRQGMGPDTRRKSRLACDNCARLRVKCHGSCPCRRCQEIGHECHYNREIHKRGRKRKEQTSLQSDVGFTSGSLADLHAEQPQDVLDQTVEESQQNGNNSVTHSPSEVSIVSSSAGAPVWEASFSEIPPTSHRIPPINTSIGNIDSRDAPHNFDTRAPIGSSEKSPSDHPTRNPHRNYACLAPLLPYLDDIARPHLVWELLRLYFAPSEGSLFHNASPYVLTPILREETVLNPTCPRPTTPALLATMIWVSAQTASLPQLLAPGSRENLCRKLFDLVLQLQHGRDPDQWQRISGLFVQKTRFSPSDSGSTDCQQRPSPIIDDVISLILITIVLSGGEFKRDCLPWWSKAIRLVETMKIHQVDHPDSKSDEDIFPELNQTDGKYQHPHPEEAKEEIRRTFWLAFALDRHLALSFNGNLAIMDGESYVYAPLPERLWQAFNERSLSELSARHYGPSALVTGTGFFEFFLPLMVLLGDIIQLRRRRNHPRLGTLESDGTVALVEGLLDRCKESIDKLRLETTTELSSHEACTSSINDPDRGAVMQGATPGWPITSASVPIGHDRSRQSLRALLVTAYAHFILNVLHILLHGEWDALTMLAWLPSANSPSDWITSPSFHKCSSHTIFASEAIASILDVDPELIFMPYLFGIYLFHGSLVLLLFADRMQAVHGGPNDAVEAACETVIRAHEACIVTLNTEFQRVFKRVMRATLMLVKDQNKTGWSYDTDRRMYCAGHEADGVRERIVDMRKDMLRLHRWNRGGRGLAV